MFYNPTISNYNLIFLKFQGGPFESHEEKVMKLEIIVLHIKRTMNWNSFYSFLDPKWPTVQRLAPEIRMRRLCNGGLSFSRARKTRHFILNNFLKTIHHC